MTKEKLTENQIKEIIDLNKNYTSTSQIAKRFNVSTTTIRSYFKKRNIPLIKICTSSVTDRRYFENISTPLKAYILGWMFSDGNVSVNSKGLHRISLNVQERDRFICDLMQINIGGNIDFIDNSTKNWQNQIRFTGHSEFLTSDLIKTGCLPNKTQHELNIPNISNALIIHFIRGVFDGDGSISFQSKDKTITFRISCNSFQFLQQIGEFLTNSGISKFRIFNSKLVKCSYLEIKRKSDIKLLYNLLYSLDSVSLMRKRIKWEECMKQINYN